MGKSYHTGHFLFSLLSRITGKRERRKGQRILSVVISRDYTYGFHSFGMPILLCVATSKTGNDLELFHLPTLMHSSLFINNMYSYTTILDMFRALTCPSPGGPIVFSQHLVTSLSVNGCTVHRLRADCKMSHKLQIKNYGGNFTVISVATGIMESEK
jgi:hypothetical protein